MQSTEQTTTTIRITASHGGTAIHTLVWMDSTERDRIKRAEQMRWLRVWGTWLLPLVVCICWWLYEAAMEAAPAQRMSAAGAAACAQMVVLLLGGGVIWAWAERVLGWNQNRRATLASALFALIVLAQGAFAPLAMAAAPEDGIWWNPNAPGRGWVIVSQNDVMVVSTYTYAPGGAATWYLSAGTYTDSTRRFSGTLDATRNGQCIGCPFVPAINNGSAGPLVITFGADEKALLSQNGEVVAIEKFYYATPNRDDRLYGEWAYSSHSTSGIGDGELLVFDRQFISATGVRYIQAHRRLTTVGLALGSFQPTLNEYLVLLDSSTSFYKLYRFKMEANRFLDGRYWLYRKTESATGSGQFSTGIRVRERNDVGAPAVAKRSGTEAERAMLDEAMFIAIDADDAPLEPELADAVSKLTAEFERMREESTGIEGSR